jgi:alkylhydroperoxidase family enzyme
VPSPHCRLAHGRKSLPLFETDQLVRIARDYRDAELSAAEVEMMSFAEQVSRDPGAMTDADSLRLREAGFSDREILDITLAAAARNYYSRAIQALAVEVDAAPALSDELRDALLEPLRAPSR